jgi:hypothetical protein
MIPSLTLRSSSRIWPIARCPDAWRKREAAGIGEAEAGVAGCAFGERCGEYRGVPVVVVVDLGGGLARIGAQDPAGVLDMASLKGQRGGEEQSIQGRAIEALAV